MAAGGEDSIVLDHPGPGPLEVDLTPVLALAAVLSALTWIVFVPAVREVERPGH